MRTPESNFLVTNSKTLSFEELSFTENVYQIVYPINAGQHTQDLTLVIKSLHFKIQEKFNI